MEGMDIELLRDDPGAEALAADVAHAFNLGRGA